MTTVYEVNKNMITPEEHIIYAELRGLSTDEKPTEINGKSIGNGSSFIEIDTGKIFFYDLEHSQWKEV